MLCWRFGLVTIDLHTHIQGLLGTIIDGQSSSRITSATDWKRRQTSSQIFIQMSNISAWIASNHIQYCYVKLIPASLNKNQTWPCEVRGQGNQTFRSDEKNELWMFPHTTSHSGSDTHTDANVTVTEPPPADRTGLWCASVRSLLASARTFKQTAQVWRWKLATCFGSDFLSDTTCGDITFTYFASRERTCCLSPSGPLWILVCRTACNIPSFWYSTHQAELKICQGTWRHTAAGGKASF